MGGILGAALGKSAVETEARIEEAKKTATDLTGLVRKKGKAVASPAAAVVEATASETNGGKRKAEDNQEDQGGEAAKKARTEEQEGAVSTS